MLTADTITDDQVREMRDANLGTRDEDAEFVSVCHTALGLYEALTVEAMQSAREQCASAWNALQAKNESRRARLAADKERVRQVVRGAIEWAHQQSMAHSFDEHLATRVADELCKETP